LFQEKQRMIDTTSLPKKPGCYLFKDNLQKVIYVGKAKDLNKRVKSYFRKTGLDAKTQVLVHNISDLEIVVTDSEVEALMLENTLIKRYQPKFNINLKDAKNFAYIRVTDEQYPRLLIARNTRSKGSFYGPFVNAADRDYILKFLRRIFRIRTCKRLPKRPCLRYHIKLCDAPCQREIDEKTYQERIRQVKEVLTGHTEKIIDELEEGMRHDAEQEHFEEALIKRNQIAALSRLSQRQKMVRKREYNEDVIAYRIQEGTVYLLLFHIYKGTLSDRNEFLFSYSEDWLEEFLVQYYSENPIPKEIILPDMVSEPVPQYLSSHKKQKVRVVVPKKGLKAQLLDLALRNVDVTFFSASKKVQELTKALNLKESATVIECFDISHLSGTGMVGSMVQFRNGRPDKNGYRRFKIRSVEGIDDVACIYEVVKRRYSRLIKENADMPNLIVIDGGKTQLSSAQNALEELGLILPIVSLAKREEELFFPGRAEPLVLSKKHGGLQLVMQIRDEAHRFAITYNRLLRKKELLES